MVAGIVVSIFLGAAAIMMILLRLQAEWDGGPPHWASYMSMFGLPAFIVASGFGIAIGGAMLLFALEEDGGEPPGAFLGVVWALIIGSIVAAIVVHVAMRRYHDKNMAIGPKGTHVIRAEGSRNAAVYAVGVVSGVSLCCVLVVGLLIALFVFAAVIAFVIMFLGLAGIGIATMAK